MCIIRCGFLPAAPAVTAAIPGAPFGYNALLHPGQLGLSSGRTPRRELDERRSRRGQAPFPDRRHQSRPAPWALRSSPYRSSPPSSPAPARKAMGAPVEVDISKLEPGAMVKVEWRGKASLHRAPHAADAGPARRHRRRAARSRIGGVRPARIRQERCARAEARIPGAGRRLHAPRLRAARASSSPAPHGLGRTGRAASSAPATAPSSTSPDACSRTSRRPPTCRSRRTSSWPIPAS